jgi:hypothetical protein
MTDDHALCPISHVMFIALKINSKKIFMRWSFVFDNL